MPKRKRSDDANDKQSSSEMDTDQPICDEQDNCDTSTTTQSQASIPTFQQSFQHSPDLVTQNKQPTNACEKLTSSSDDNERKDTAEDTECSTKVVDSNGDSFSTAATTAQDSSNKLVAGEDCNEQPQPCSSSANISKQAADNQNQSTAKPALAQKSEEDEGENTK